MTNDTYKQTGTEQRISDMLQQLPEQQAPGRVLRRAMQQIATEQKLARHRAMNVGFSLAFAASLFAAVIVPGLLEHGDDNSQVLSSITMSMSDQRMINIVFDSPEAVAEATITVSLPDNVRIAGYESVPELRWNTALRAGKNTLSLPLVARSGGEGIVRSQLEINGQARHFTVLVNVGDSLTPQSAITVTNT